MNGADKDRPRFLIEETAPMRLFQKGLLRNLMSMIMFSTDKKLNNRIKNARNHVAMCLNPNGECDLCIITK